jgi:hypothetical protein
MDFNPFDKEFEEIELGDLNKLIDQEVSEGWYVEFKEDFPSTKKIGRSVAAFANSDGGWLIIGIKTGRHNNKAETLVGFNISDNDKPIDRIRDIVKNHVIPIPYFKTKFIRLDSGKGVLLVLIRSGDEAPYLTKEGKIYRRVGEGSDPVPESDRYAIQKLFDRSAALKEQISHFCNNEFILPKSDKNISFLEAYFYNIPIDSFLFRDFTSPIFVEKLKDIFSAPIPFIEDSPLSMNFTITNLSSSSGSYILRTVMNNDEAITVRLMIEIYDNGHFKFILPLPQYSDYIGLNTEYENSQHLKSFAEIMHHYRMLRVFDGYNLIVVYVTILNQYIKLLKSYQFDGDLRGRLRLTNLWRSLVYLNSNEYIDFIKTYGLPICLKDEIEMPPYYDKMGFKFDINQDSGISHLGSIIEALGFPRAFISVSILRDFFKHMINKSSNPIND